MSLFTLKYAPQNEQEVFGQQKAVQELKQYVTTYKQQKQKAALLVGPIGVGKTASVYALAKQLNYDILEINSSDLRNADSISTFLGSALGQQSLFFKPKIILVDEVDNISGVKDRGCIPALIKAIDKSAFPVILTANDIEDSKFKAIKKATKQIAYHKLDHRTIANLLQTICTKEQIKVEEKALNSLARQADGDARAALLDLHICAAKKKLEYSDVISLSDRKRTESIKNALMLIFKSSSVQNALPALDDVDVDLDHIIFWIDNNLPKEYTAPKALAKAYEHLARADVFRGRVKRRQHWRFLVYINNLLTAGISSAKKERNPAFVNYMPTMRLLRIWQSNIKNAKKKEIAKKLAIHLHTSSKTAMRHIPYLQSIIKHGNTQQIAHDLDLTDDEVDWLMK